MGASAVRKDDKITPKSDQQGVVVAICDPGWFDKKKTYQIKNSPQRTADLVFTGEDLNFLARILYAEASGSQQLVDKDERDKEKEAILNVKHFRLARTDYPNWRVKHKTFTEVCSAPGRFESFGPPPTSKFSGSTKSQVETFSKNECADFTEAINAIKAFLEAGPNSLYKYDNFRGGSGKGTKIGRSRFWLSATGKRLSDAED